MSWQPTHLAKDEDRSVCGVTSKPHRPLVLTSDVALATCLNCRNWAARHRRIKEGK